MSVWVNGFMIRPLPCPDVDRVASLITQRISRTNPAETLRGE
jgi:hypothetical protein